MSGCYRLRGWWARKKVGGRRAAPNTPTAPGTPCSSTGVGRRNRLPAAVADEPLQARVHLVPAEAHWLRLLPPAVNGTQEVADASERMQEIPLASPSPGDLKEEPGALVQQAHAFNVGGGRQALGHDQHRRVAEVVGPELRQRAVPAAGVALQFQGPEVRLG